MSSQNDAKLSSIDSDNKLSLRRETVRNLSVRSGVKTGGCTACTTTNPYTVDTCKNLCSKSAGSGV